MEIKTVPVSIIREDLEKQFSYTFNTFRNAIVDSHALIAGGGVLAPYADFKSNDLDIYIHPQHAIQFIQTMEKKLGYTVSTQGQLTPAYDQSFFRKNHILARFRLIYLFDSLYNLSQIHITSTIPTCSAIIAKWWTTSSKGQFRSPKSLVSNYKENRKLIRQALLRLKQQLFNDNIVSYAMMSQCLKDFLNNQKLYTVSFQLNEDLFIYDHLELPSIDIMIIHPDYPLSSIVTNFDLTFCQIWYDGKSVHTSHITDIQTKSGSLQPDYIKTYAEGNGFLERRIDKYRKRGFSVSIPSYTLLKKEGKRIYDKKKDEYIMSYKRSKTVSQPLEWIVKLLYDYFIHFLYPNPEEKMYVRMCKYPLLLEPADYERIGDRNNYGFNYSYHQLMGDTIDYDSKYRKPIYSVYDPIRCSFIKDMELDDMLQAVSRKRLKDVLSIYHMYLFRFLPFLGIDEIFKSIDMLEESERQQRKRRNEIPIDIIAQNEQIVKIEEHLGKRHPSITLLINSHGMDEGFIEPPLQHLLDQRVQIAYMISSNTLHFFDRLNYQLLELEYLSNNAPLSNQRSNSEIMDLFITDCKEHYVQDEAYVESSYVGLEDSKESAKHMVATNRQCYRGKAVINRVYGFTDENFFTKEKTLPPWIKNNSPFMGSMYVLRASYDDGTYEHGDLLQPLYMSNRLQPLQILIQEILLDQGNEIDSTDLLTVLAERFEHIYIYDYACRTRGNKNAFTRVPALQRNLSTIIYEQESTPIFNRAPSSPIGSQTQLVPYQQPKEKENREEKEETNWNPLDLGKKHRSKKQRNNKQKTMRKVHGKRK